jgi:hypothetical protein
MSMSLRYEDLNLHAIYFGTKLDCGPFMDQLVKPLYGMGIKLSGPQSWSGHYTEKDLLFGTYAY